jgi:hypothetical protein
MTTSDHRHNERNNGHDNHTKDDEIDSGKELGVFFSIQMIYFLFNRIS